MAESKHNALEVHSAEDIASLEKMLHLQQQLLQKLHQELDEEREASSCAASEAMSLILRLQTEKAALQLEANHYKIIPEHKMRLAEESHVAFEDLIYKREIEISSLEFQVEACRCKLLSMGFPDHAECECVFEGNSLLNQNDTFIGEGMVVDGNTSRSSIDREISPVPVSDFPHEMEEEAEEEDVQHPEFEELVSNSTDDDSYWGKICKPEERVKEMSDCPNSNTESEKTNDDFSPFSLLSPASTRTSYNPTNELVTKDNGNKHAGDFMENESIIDSPCSSNVYDVFEVPQGNGCRESSFHENDGKFFLEREIKPGEPDSVPEEISQIHLKDENELVKGPFRSENHGVKLSRLRGEMSANCQEDLVHPAIFASEYQAEVQQLRQRIEKLEGEREHTKEELCIEGEGGMKLLKGVLDQLNSIQFEMKILKNRNFVPSNDSDVLPIMEAMLSFWL